MTEPEIPSGAPPEAATAPAAPIRTAPAPRPRPEAEPATEIEPAKRGLAYWLNPVNWFRRVTPETLVKVGQKLVETRNLHQAMGTFQKALELKPTHAPAHRGLAKVCIARGGRTNLEKALVHLGEAMRCNAFDEPSYSLTALVLDKLGKVEAAQMARKKLAVVRALQLDAANPIANNNMGVVILSQGHPETALDYFRKAIDANRRYDSAYRNLAVAHFQLAVRAPENSRGDHIARAEEAILQALNLSKTVHSLLIRARIAVMKGDLEAALNAVNEAQVIEPQNKDGFAVKQLVMEKLGRMADAQIAHEQYQSQMRQES
jgi:Flp pilus assembly protein TadD